jgi:YD repeat-containing protein
LLSLKYDAWNRLVEVKRASTVLATYEYDGLHRRIVRTAEPGTGNEKEYHSYYNLDWQELEVRGQQLRPRGCRRVVIRDDIHFSDGLERPSYTSVVSFHELVDLRTRSDFGTFSS